MFSIKKSTPSNVAFKEIQNIVDDEIDELDIRTGWMSGKPETVHVCVSGRTNRTRVKSSQPFQHFEKKFSVKVSFAILYSYS